MSNSCTGHSTKSVNHLLEGKELQASILAVCSELVASWKNVTVSGIQVSTISGGISNALYKVECKDMIQSNKLVVRVYGDNTEKFVDRKEEVGMMEVLHKNGFGPSVLGTFSNGRIESFLDLVCLQPDDIAKPIYVKNIAKTLGEFHLVSESWTHPENALTPFERTKEWLQISKTMDFSECKKMDDLYKSLDVDSILKEVEAVATASARLESPLVLCHNDLLSGNIMVDRDGDDIRHMTFIDFEYADWAPRGFDLGNHFCEYAGFDGDYSRPSGQALTLIIWNMRA